MEAVEWFQKRFLKILIPFIIYSAILEFGNGAKFFWTLQHNLLIRSVDQLGYFFPVLWILYVCFLPINSLKTRRLFTIWLIFLAAILGYFILKTHTLYAVSENTLTSGLFFLASGIAVFVFGILISRVNFQNYFKNKNIGLIAIGACLVVLPQVFHKWFFHLNSKLVILNLYFAIISIFGFFVFFNSNYFGKSSECINLLKKIGACSLAVYFVHFKMMDFVKMLNINFPYNVWAIFIYSFIFALPLTQFAEFISNKALNFVGQGQK